MSVTVSQLELLGKLMDASELRHRVISQNVANVNTPGYRRLAVSFEDELALRLKSAANSTADGLTPSVFEEPGLPARGRQQR